MSRILCVGALTQDTIYQVRELPVLPRKYLATGRSQAQAGMASSAAIAAARLGGRPQLWASVGQDSIGDTLVGAMKAEGVDCSLVRQVPGGHSATAVIIVAEGGERMVVAHYPESNKSISGPIPVLDGFGAVLTDTRWPDAAELALTAAAEAGLPAVLDADTAAPDILLRLARCANQILASTDGAQLLSGEADPERATRSIHNEFGGVVAVTAGAKGCFWTDDPTNVHYTPAPTIEAVDTNAAGDVFHGAYCLSIAEGKTVAASIEFAVCAAALKCTRPGGATGAPSRRELHQFMVELGR